MRVLNESVIGGLTGGTIGGTAGVAAPKKAGVPSEEELAVEGDALPAEQPDAEAEALPEVQEAEIEEAANEAATSPTNDLPEPTEAQKEAGNYKVGKIKLQGLDISIENPKGSVRKGKDKDGEEWSVTLPSHYGYLKRTEGADGDQVDVYLSDSPAQSDPVFVVDQVDAETGAFDEHKVFIGYPTQEQVEQTYDAAFDDGKGPDRRKSHPLHADGRVQDVAPGGGHHETGRRSAPGGPRRAGHGQACRGCHGAGRGRSASAGGSPGTF